MLKRASKKGQFYIVAALIIITALIGIISVSNYSRKESNLQINSIKKELQAEIRYTTDYLLYNEYSQDERHNFLTEFSRNYSSYIGKDKSVYFVFGNTSNISVSGYQNSDRVINLSSARTSSEITRNEGEFQGSINPNSEEATLYIDELKYDFNLSENFNFYFVISQTTENGRYFVSG